MNRIQTNIFNQHYFLSPDGVAANLPFVINLLKGNFQKIDFSDDRQSNRMHFLSGNTYTISEYGETLPPEQAPKDSIAVIPINGVITKADQSCGPSGTDTKKNLLARCGANPDINGIILQISSPGGEAFASIDFYKAIIDFKNTYNKTVVAFIDDCGCSGAMYVAAAADKIVCSDELTQVGSIGVVSHILDQIKTLENEGIIAKEIYAAESSEKNIEVREALNGNDKPLLQRSSVLVNRFIADVKATRTQITTDTIDPFKGKTLFAKEAITIGLIDEIGSIASAAKFIQTNYSTNLINSSMNIPFKSGWAAIAALFTAKKDGDVLTDADMDTMNSALTNRQSTIDQLTTDLSTANSAKTTAETAQKKAENELTTANNLLKTTKDSLVAAESQLTNMITALDAIDNSVKEAKSSDDKINAVTALLAAKPGTAASGVQSKKDENISKDGVDWATLEALPHMQ
ncbi:MAG: S49 family peptidase [Bacteroidetes bacterium]|nr:S49 family peptidase [Bacteroidota bacterium]